MAATWKDETMTFIHPLLSMVRVERDGRKKSHLRQEHPDSKVLDGQAALEFDGGQQQHETQQGAGIIKKKIIRNQKIISTHQQ